MKTPAALVSAALMAAILLAASFLIAAGTRGEGTLPMSSPGTTSERHHPPLPQNAITREGG